MTDARIPPAPDCRHRWGELEHDEEHDDEDWDEGDWDDDDDGPDILDAARSAARAIALDADDVLSQVQRLQWTMVREAIGLTWDPLDHSSQPPADLVASLDRGYGGESEVAGLRYLFVRAAELEGTHASPFDGLLEASVVVSEIWEQTEGQRELHARTPGFITALTLQLAVSRHCLTRLLPGLM